MYLYKAIYDNVGPLDTVCFEFTFNEAGRPKPIIIVGENGSGKSTVLSNIVDAFYEMAGQQFTNARQRSDEGIGSQFYKVIARTEIHSGANYMASYLLFKGIKEYSYSFKCGDIEADAFASKYGFEKGKIHWNETENFKHTSISKENALDEWSHGVICYFGPERYECPSWMGEKYYNIEDYSHPSINTRLEGKLDNPISVKSVTADTLQWLLDIIADSRADIRCNNDRSLSIEHVDVNNLILLRQARTNIEAILSKIVGEEVYFSLNFRSEAGSRFKILRKRDNSVFCPSLDSLSTGQAALLNMFATIIRYADRNDINKSIKMQSIQGIVVIDEIELHLHTNLQKETLPELIKLFPRIQFIITSHSPLFLLGMRDTFGSDNFEVYEMPTATKIDVEKFLEFQKAYDYLKRTQKYHEEAEKAIRSIAPQGKTIIITEGYTDWKHIKAAYNALKADVKHHALFDTLDFEFFEYGPKASTEYYQYEIEMGNTVLCTLCENLAKIPQINRYIFIADRDDKNTSKRMSCADAQYKNWGNNVFSFILPIPPHRVETPNICIEHLYTNEEIKTEWTDQTSKISRRLFMGNEFDEYGHAAQIGRFCERKDLCGKNKISIIEGTSGERVLDINAPKINYALPKSKFAELILKCEPPFGRFNFDNFVPIFEIIKKIAIENMRTEHLKV